MIILTYVLWKADTKWYKPHGTCLRCPLSKFAGKL